MYLKRKMQTTCATIVPTIVSVDFLDGAQTPFGPIYNFSQNELSSLRGYLDKNFAKNLVRCELLIPSWITDCKYLAPQNLDRNFKARTMSDNLSVWFIFAFQAILRTTLKQNN